MTGSYRPPPPGFSPDHRPSPPAPPRVNRPNPYADQSQPDPYGQQAPQYARRDPRAAYNAEYDEMAERRQYARHNPYAPVYDDGMLGQTDRNDLRRLDTPVEYDPIIRQEVYSEMGAALRGSLNSVRSRGERHVESTRLQARPDDGSSDRPSSGMSIREARQAMTSAQRRFLQEDQQQRLSPEPEEYEPYSDEDDDYEPPQPPRSRRSPYGPVQAAAQPGRGRIRPPDEQNGSHRPADSRRPARRTRPDQASVPSRNAPASNGRVGKPGQVRSVRPSQPQYLAPDGSIPHNPCGMELVIDIDNIRHVVSCCEETRDSDQSHPAHLNIPHIARINDPRLPRYGVNAFIVWNLDSEAPR